MKKSKEIINGYRLSEHTYCIADEMLQKGILNQSKEQYKSCGSSDALSTYVNEYEDGTEKFSSYCFSCSQSFRQDHLAKSSLAGEFGLAEDGQVVEKKTFERKPKAEPITKAQRIELFKMTGGTPENKWITHSAKGYRNLSDESIQFYGFRVELKHDGSVKAFYFPETSDGKIMGYKSRHDPKGFGYNNVGRTGASNDLSGQSRFPDGGRTCVIVGGEFDMIAAQDMFRQDQCKRGYEDYNRIAVVSPTTGEGSAASQCRNQYEWFDKFDNIVIGLDNDEVGRESALALAEVLPKEKVKIARWSGKDPNKMLIEGKERQFMSDYYKAEEYIKSGIVGSSKLEDAIFDEIGLDKIPLPPFMSQLQSHMAGGIPLGYIVNLIADTGCGKCHGKDTPIMMADGTIKMVQDVKVGEKVMGADGSVRNVLNTVTGKENMYKVIQNKGDSYEVNESHILSLKATTNFRVKGVSYLKGQVVNISIKDYLGMGSKFQRLMKGYKANLVNLDAGNTLSIDPYLLGLWLAEGSSNQARLTISKQDEHLLSEVSNVCEKQGYNFRYTDRGESGCYRVDISGGFYATLKEEGLLGNKHIPTNFKTSSYENRKNLLGGILAGDGHLYRNCFEIVQKEEGLAKDVVWLARSLGLQVSISEKIVEVKSGVNKYYRIVISGNTDIIDTRLSRKNAKPRSINKDPLVTSIYVESLGLGDYYGFALDGDHLYCLGDFTVTHNTTIANECVYDWIFNSPYKVGIVSLELDTGQYGISLLSRHLNKKIQLFQTKEEAREFLNTPENIEKRKNLWTNEFGEDRFHLLDDRDGDLESLKKKILQMILQYECKFLIIDPLQDALDGYSNEDQAVFMKWMKQMVKRYKVSFFNVNHVRKEGNSGFDRFLKEADIQGSSAIAKSAGCNIIFTRDKLAEDSVSRNVTKVFIPKCRWTGSTGDGGLWYYSLEQHTLYDLETYFKDNPDKVPFGMSVEDLIEEQKAMHSRDKNKKDNKNNNTGNKVAKPKTSNDKDFMDDLPI